jgi:hypothetical protein
MSDGPHKSLPMSRAWKELSKRADQQSYSRENILLAVKPALVGDWNSEKCDIVVSQIRNISEGQEHSGLFEGQLTADLEALRRETPGRPMARRILDGTIEGLSRGLDTETALQSGASAALKERALRGSRSCEEHWTRLETDKRTFNMRQRLESALGGSDFPAIGRQLLGSPSGRPNSALPAKMRGLDDGISIQ